MEETVDLSVQLTKTQIEFMRYMKDGRRMKALDKIGTMQAESEKCFKELEEQMLQCEKCVIAQACTLHNNLIWSIHNYIRMCADKLKFIKSLRE